jgi:hypothetical protein
LLVVLSSLQEYLNTGRDTVKQNGDARYTVQCLAASNTTAIIKYAGSEIYVTIDLILDGGKVRTSTKAELS